MNPANELTVGQLVWIDRQIANQIRDKIELLPDEEYSFTTSAVRLKTGDKFIADLTTKYITGDPMNFEYCSEDGESYIDPIHESVYLVSIEVMIIDKFGDGYIVHDVVTDAIEKELDNLTDR